MMRERTKRKTKRNKANKNSESSLFVAPHLLILKTCGTTLNLLGLHRIIEIAREYCGLRTVWRCFYSRKSFFFPERQQGVHRDWRDEVGFLDTVFGAFPSFPTSLPFFLSPSSLSSFLISYPCHWRLASWWSACRGWSCLDWSRDMISFIPRAVMKEISASYCSLPFLHTVTTSSYSIPLDLPVSARALANAR